GEHGAGSFTKQLPPLDGRVVALRLSFPNIAAFVAGHKEAETSQGVNDAATGTLRLGGPFRRWIGVAGARADAPGVFHYVLNRAADSVIRPQEPHACALVPVVASPQPG